MSSYERQLGMNAVIHVTVAWPRTLSEFKYKGSSYWSSLRLLYS